MTWTCMLCHMNVGGRSGVVLVVVGIVLVRVRAIDQSY